MSAVPEPQLQQFRYLDQALSAPYAEGVSVGFDDAGLRMQFLVRDPNGTGDLIVIQQVVVDPTAAKGLVEQLAAQISQRRA